VPTSHCVIIPFLNRFTLLADCLQALQSALLAQSQVLLVNDGSDGDPWLEPGLRTWLSHSQIHLVEHPKNLGVAASRNSALHWCRRNNIDIAIMLDSDCRPPSNFIKEHLQLHKDHPQAAAIGGAIVGRGKGLWAELDNVTSWVHAMPHGQHRQVDHPYHLPTTNLSLKIKKLPPEEQVFDERLITGEDAQLIRKLRAAGEQALFSPQPVVEHQDREDLISVIKHHYDWGHHQYFVQLGRDFSRPVFQWWYRLPFALIFLLATPLYALMGSVLNIKPWLKYKPHYLGYFPLIYILWCGKSLALLCTALNPRRYLRVARVELQGSYTERKNP